MLLRSLTLANNRSKTRYVCHVHDRACLGKASKDDDYNKSKDARSSFQTERNKLDRDEIFNQRQTKPKEESFNHRPKLSTWSKCLILSSIQDAPRAFCLSIPCIGWVGLIIWYNTLTKCSYNVGQGILSWCPRGERKLVSSSIGDFLGLTRNPPSNVERLENASACNTPRVSP